MSLVKKTYVNKRISKRDEELLFELIDYKTVLICNNVSEPNISVNLLIEVS